MAAKTYTLSELTSYIHRVVALNFPEPLWVKCEILQVKSSRGHQYLELVQKQPDSEQVDAQLSAVLWGKDYLRVKNQLGDVIHQLLQQGTEVALQCEVQYHPVFGLKLRVLDFDASYTLGQLEVIRQATITRLKQLHLIEKNRLTNLPQVVQRIAIVSNRTASGYQDFINHLQQNEFQFQFQTQLYHNALQGSSVKGELLENVALITERKHDFDAVVIIRGGGSRFDLSAFDDFDVAEAIANLPLPVLTGIGHETDKTVADLVSYQSFKTPTAVASFLLDRNLLFISTVLNLQARIHRLATHQVQKQVQQLDRLSDQIYFLSRKQVDMAKFHLQKLTTRVGYESKMRIEQSRRYLRELQTKIELLDPRLLLQKGYTFTEKKGERVESTTALRAGDLIRTYFRDGSAESVVKKITKS